MKHKSLYSLTLGCFLFALFGCSKSKPVEKSEAPFPFSQIKVVVTPELKEQEDTAHEAFALLKAKDYDGLEASATEFCLSKKAYANGTWRLGQFYFGLEPADKSEPTVWPVYQKFLQDWVRARPGSATARIALGRFWVSYAWEARGSGLSSTVTEEGWKLMGSRLLEAQKVLTEARGLKTSDPVLWSSLMKVGLGMQWVRSRYDETFNTAVQEHPEYTYYYMGRAIFLLPRWYGNPGEWESDLAKSADRVGGDKGDLLYAQVVANAREYVNVFAKPGGVSWPRVDRGFKVLLAQFPDSLWAKNQRVLLAAMAGDRPAAQKYLLETKGEVESDPTQDAKSQMEKLYIWAFGQPK